MHKVMAQLAQSLDVASALKDHSDYFTIQVTTPTGSVEHLARLWPTQLRTLEGKSYPWTIGEPSDNKASLARFD